MYPQSQNSLNKPQLVIAIQHMVEVHAELMRVLTQNLINSDNKELPPGMQQVLDDHSRMVQMIPQILASTNDNLPQNKLGNNKPRGSAKITLQAYKSCGEIGHTSKECHEQCPHCDTRHPIEECPMAHVTCFLCDGINHGPRECKFYFTVQQMNQQAKDRLSPLLVRTLVDGRPKLKMGTKVMERTPEATTKCCFSCEEEGPQPCYLFQVQTEGTLFE
jgi:hypothetical protein